MIMIPDSMIRPIFVCIVITEFYYIISSTYCIILRSTVEPI